ncbi:cellulase family glycosylhydrolase [Abyssalbus ytuae]|uniref:Cellulase family glycosylhydrolase n=1 Tax=Abyssalbus ytuae TaxID=2926907 RepID=A0A9E6ZLY5_9FLAO|nr:cellulase family glycosylhydrolase [Abyssalbus ytuae]UOB16635.1 cellulase family glycosylhydrolase [Abyssalbus ytuae]
MKYYITILSILFSVAVNAQGFLHAEGQKIVDENGNNILLRGLGLGGWMVQESYMLQTSAFAGPQHTIKEKITELIGKKNTQEFYRVYLENSITRRDIDSLKAWGFNSVRLPMHYNLYTPPIEEEKEGEITWKEKGFQMTDSLLKWCRVNKMYLILDLHAAPGGQGNDANISDYDKTKPSLWESEANKQKTIALWKKLAERYKDETWIGGYDIINEPNWNFVEGENPNGLDEKKNEPLRQLMVDITKVIREVDQNHMIIIEGNGWGNNYNGIFPLWDNNMVISFHKYWNYNTQESIQFILDFRKKYNAPVWLGESGENSNVWFRDAIKLVEFNNVGWAFWPMKKVDNIAGVTSVTKNPEYAQLLNYWQYGGEKPTVEFAKKALMQMVENFKMENVTVKQDVIDAMFRQVQTAETKAYKDHSVPGRIYATEYNLGTQGYAYFDEDFVNYRVNTGKYSSWNNGHKMRNDGVDIQVCKDEETNGYEVFDIKDKEWLLFTVNVKQTGKYLLKIRYASEKSHAKLHLEVDTQSFKIVNLIPTGNNNSYSTAEVPGIYLKKGIQKIKVVFDKGGVHVNYFEFH